VIRTRLLPLLVITASCASPTRPDYDASIQTRVLMKADATSIGQKIKFIECPGSEVTMMKITIPPGKETGWHQHPIHVFAHVLKGRLTVELEDGRSMSLDEGASFAEAIHTMHNGRNLGADDVVLIAFYLGEKNKPLVIRR
jgi:quercetin dioxygenase-like cupin family protein